MADQCSRISRETGGLAMPEDDEEDVEAMSTSSHSSEIQTPTDSITWIDCFAAKLEEAFRASANGMRGLEQPEQAQESRIACHHLQHAVGRQRQHGTQAGVQAKQLWILPLAVKPGPGTHRHRQPQEQDGGDKRHLTATSPNILGRHQRRNNPGQRPIRFMTGTGTR